MVYRGNIAFGILSTGFCFFFFTVLFIEKGNSGLFIPGVTLSASGVICTTVSRKSVKEDGYLMSKQVPTQKKIE